MKSLKNYSILILAAGKGSRLKKIGKKIPKCLIKISNKTFLEILIDHLKKKGVKKINIVLGYKKEMIINRLKKIKDINFNPIIIKNFSKHGHAMSWFSFKNKWLKEKKSLLIFHGDILFDKKFLNNLIHSKKKNLIGVINKNKSKYKNESLVVASDKVGLIKKIGLFRKIKNPKGEVLGINKFSAKTTKKIFHYMSNFLIGKNKKLSWEFVIDRFIQETNEKIYMLFNQNYSWVNINTIKDLNLAKKVYKRIYQ